MCPLDTWSQIIEDSAHQLKIVAYEEEGEIWWDFCNKPWKLLDPLNYGT